jgi:two-component system, OmpR family, phosphate regulon sensor histidine kinase PhoR
MQRASLAGWDAKRLRRVLGLFFLALAIPAGALIHQAYSQLKWAAFHQHQLLAEELAGRIDGRLGALVREEESRPFADYGFLVAAGNPPGTFLQRSPLSAFPVASAFPGLIGYFQVDAAGTLTTPLLPSDAADAAAYGVSTDELSQRVALQDRLRQILTANRLVKGGKPGTRAMAAAPSAPRAKDGAAAMAGGVPVASSDEEKAAPQVAFDRLNEAVGSARLAKRQEPRSALGRVDDLKLDDRFQQAAPAPPADEPARQLAAQATVQREQRAVRKERSVVPQVAVPAHPAQAGEAEAKAAPPRVDMFESEIDPLQASLLDSGHFVLFRQVWRNGQRYIQGLLLDQQALLRGAIESAYRETVLSQTTDLAVAWRGDLLSAFSGEASRGYLSSAQELRGALLQRTRLSAPLDGMELVFSVKRLPAGPGAEVVTVVAAVLLLVLCGGFLLLYRLGLRQIALARQQQDFVSAVSHELKTPLTSIRMYGELLREGWATDEKKTTYYAYIQEESERLSRLIDNVLQLARMTRNELRLAPRAVTVRELMHTVRAKIASAVEQAGFALRTDCAPEAAEAIVAVDVDAFSQILINLVDNAVKFSAKAENKAVDIGCRLGPQGRIVISVRDYGPGVPKDQMREIFRLFYRPDSGLTRETLGTGIGLALVRQLTEAMGGTVDVANREPGAEFSVTLPQSRPEGGIGS